MDDSCHCTVLVIVCWCFTWSVLFNPPTSHFVGKEIGFKREHACLKSSRLAKYQGWRSSHPKPPGALRGGVCPEARRPGVHPERNMKAAGIHWAPFLGLARGLW